MRVDEYLGTYGVFPIGLDSLRLNAAGHGFELTGIFMTTEAGSPMARWGRAKFVEIFGADLRSLAAFRIVLAAIVLADLAGRATDLTVHYTDDGVLPRSMVLRELNEWQFSVNLMNGTTFFQALLFGVTALAALALLLGFHTRLMSVVVWVMMVSIQWRNPLVLSDADTLLRVLLFWAMFLPLGACWSVDRARHPIPTRLSMRFLSLATVALFLQIAFVYWFTVILKTGREWRTDGTALYYALSAEHLTTPIGAYVRQFTTPLKVLTYVSFWLEALGPCLLFFPVRTALVRTGAILAIMSLHLGILLTLDLGLFPWLSAFCMVSFLPSRFWDVTVPRFRAVLPGLADLARFPQKAAARLAPAFSPLRARSAAWGSVGIASPAGVAADASVEQLGGFELRPGTAPTFPAPSEASTAPVRVRSSLVTNLLAVSCLVYVFLWNLTTVSDFSMPDDIRPVGNLLGLKQSWNMFAPRPTTVTGWYVIPGTLSDGRQVDLVRAVVHDDPELVQDVSWERPDDLDAIFEDKYWRKYLDAIRDDSAQRRYFAQYVCREWNATHDGGSELVSLQFVYVKEKTLPDQRRGAPRRDVLTEHTCT